MQNLQSCSPEKITCPPVVPDSYTSKNLIPNNSYTTRNPILNEATIPKTNILCVNPCVIEEADSIHIPFSLAINDVVNLLIDTGSQITILKKSCVKGNAICYTDYKAYLKGISDSLIATYGICYGEFKIGGVSITHPVHLVKDNFPIPQDGILGKDFLIKYKANIDYNNSVLSFSYENKIIPLPFDTSKKKTIINIPARSEVIHKVKTSHVYESLCLSAEICEGVYVGNSIIKPVHGYCFITFINTNEKSVTIENPPLSFENLELYNVLSINKTPCNLDRLTLLTNSIRMSHMSSDERESILEICKSFHEIFFLDSDTLSCTDTMTHSIPTTDDIPINVRPYRLPYHQQEEVKRQIDKMLKDDIISESKSAYNSPLLVVPKKPDIHGNRKWRVVVDFRKLNDKTLSEVFPLPNITEILDQLGNSKFFSTIDLASGYHQVRTDPKDKHKTAFSTSNNHYEFNRMPFGLKGAPFTFTKLMNSVLLGFQGIKCFVYLDDVIIYGKTLEDHNSKLKDVFTRFRLHNLKLQPEKCEFLRPELTYLGHTITADGIKPDENKIKAIKNFPTPKSPTEIKQFMGLAGYYRRHIQNFAKIAQPMNNLLKKNTNFYWCPLCVESFETLKEKLCNPPVLQYPDFSKEFILTCDASNFSVGAVLSQGTVGTDRPIAFASRTLNKAEKNYSVIEKELLAITWGVKHYRAYLYGRKFLIVTDHKPLIWLFSVKDPGSRLMKFRLKLEEYEYEIIHKPGKYNTNADALSRVVYDVNPVSTRNKNYDLNQITFENFLIEKESTIIINNNIKDSHKSVSESNPEYLRAYFIGKDNSQLPDDLNDEAKCKLQSETLTVLKPSPITINNINYVFIPTHEPNTIVTNKIIFEAIKCLNSFAHTGGYHKIAFSNLTKYFPYKSLQIENIRIMFRYIFRDNSDLVEIHHNNLIKIKSKEEIRKILKEFHDCPLGGHLGVNKTYNKIRSKYKWSNQYKSVKNFVKSCDLCQRNKSSKYTKMPLTITSTASKPFEKVSLDIVGPLSLTNSRNKYILTFQDELTKFCEAVPLENQEAETIAGKFVSHIICRHGTPTYLLTDQGQNFLSELFKNVCKLLKITKIQTTAFRPQSNGSLERSHKSLGEYLRNFVEKDQLDWDTWIPYAIFTYNTSVHSATNFTPFELLYGFPAEIPNSLQKPPELNYNYDDYANELKSRLQHSYDLAKQNLIKFKEKSKTTYDLAINPVTFKKGEMVLLKNQSNAKGKCKKLEPIWNGPYKVIKANSEINSTILVKNKHQKVHNNRLKLYNSR